MSTCLFGYSPFFVTLKYPVALEANSAIFMMNHRFLGRLSDEPLENLFGLDQGANVLIGLSYQLSPTHRVYVERTGIGKEYDVGYQYNVFKRSWGSISLDFMRIYAKYFRQYESHFNSTVSYITPSIVNDRLSLLVNASYDEYYDALSAGFGMSINLTQTISLLGEWLSTSGRFGQETTKTIGIQLETIGHRFFVYVHNNLHPGIANQFQGANADFYLGFKLARLLYW